MPSLPPFLSPTSRPLYTCPGPFEAAAAGCDELADGCAGVFPAKSDGYLKVAKSIRHPSTASTMPVANWRTPVLTRPKLRKAMLL